MRILVTGGCGFIGSGFTRRLIQQFPFMTLVNIDYLYPCSTKATDLTVSHDNYHFVHGDIKDKALIESILREHKIDTIVHFAAQSHVDTSFTNPMLYTHDNVLGTHSLLEASRTVGTIKKFVHISTDEVYGENSTGETFKTEESLLKPTNPYAASKAGAEMLVHSYLHSFQFPAVIIRSNNVYGIGQYPEKVIPRFAFLLKDNKKLTLQGSGHQLRSFLHIDDAVDAVMCVMFQGHVGEIYNISSKDEISIRELAERMLAIMKPGEDISEWIEYIEDRHFNDQRYWIQSEPLRRLGWKQRVDFDKGLRETIDWFNGVDRDTYWCDKEGRKVALMWGGKGWIGGQMKTALENRGWTVHIAKSRADNDAAVRAEVEAVQPTNLVSLLGRTHGPGFGTIDYLEQKGKLVENMRDNLYAPLVLAQVAKETGRHLFYMGTGCIFEFDDEHTMENGVGFKEGDNPNFFGSSYSVVKGYTDRLMKAYDDCCLNVRIRMPISSEDGPRNFITKIIQYPRICSIPNSMTVLDDFFPIFADCMEKKVTGALNAVNPGLIEHNTILGWYKEFQNEGHTWEEIPNSTLVSKCVAAARSNNLLDTGRLKELYPSIPNIDVSVRRIMEENKFAGREYK